MVNENEIQIEPERVIERLKKIEFRLLTKREVEDGEKEQPYTPLN